MAMTVIPFGDVKAQKRWSASLWSDTQKKSYFDKFIGTGENNIIQRLTELDGDIGDRVSYDLSVMLRNKPTRGDAVSKATIDSSDKFTRELIERAVVAARMMRAQNPALANMLPVNVNGEKHYLALINPFQEYDLRTTSGATGWLEIQKAAAAAEGRNNPIFKGGVGMINNVIIHTNENVIRFSDYGTGVNLPAARALFLGKQAAVIAYGTSGGMRYFWKEETDDYGNEPTVMAGTILGMKKSRFNGYDFGVMALDTYAKDPNVT